MLRHNCDTSRRKDILTKRHYTYVIKTILVEQSTKQPQKDISSF